MKKSTGRGWRCDDRDGLLPGGPQIYPRKLLVRNLYYACFYALTALLLKEGRSFKKHTGVKAALHKDLIKEGILEPEWGKFYNKIFDSRHEGDYQPLRVFQAEEVNFYLKQCAGFIARMETLLGRKDLSPPEY